MYEIQTHQSTTMNEMTSRIISVPERVYSGSKWLDSTHLTNRRQPCLDKMKLLARTHPPIDDSRVLVKWGSCASSRLVRNRSTSKVCEENHEDLHDWTTTQPTISNQNIACCSSTCLVTKPSHQRSVSRLSNRFRSMGMLLPLWFHRALAAEVVFAGCPVIA